VTATENPGRLKISVPGAAGAEAAETSFEFTNHQKLDAFKDRCDRILERRRTIPGNIDPDVFTSDDYKCNVWFAQPGDNYKVKTAENKFTIRFITYKSSPQVYLFLQANGSMPERTFLLPTEIRRNVVPYTWPAFEKAREINENGMTYSDIDIALANFTNANDDIKLEREFYRVWVQQLGAYYWNIPLKEKEDQLTETKDQLAKTRDELTAKKEEQLTKTEKQLAGKTQQLQQTQTTLQQTKDDLQIKNAEIRDLKPLLSQLRPGPRPKSSTRLRSTTAPRSRSIISSLG